MEEDPTERLVAEAQSGVRSAFDQLVRLHYDKVYGQALRMTKSEAEARDVSQITWVKAWQKLSTFRREAAFTSWLYRIATFAALDHIRKRKARREVQLEGLELEPPPVLPSPRATPEQLQNLERQELQELVRETVSQLPEKLRATLSLREFEGLSYEEIANRLGCKTGTVMSRLFNARKIIHKQLAEILP